MKLFNKFMSASLIALTLSTVPAFALTDVDRAEIATKNVMKNPGFENGKAGWTASGGTFSTATSGSNWQEIGKASGTWDSSSASQTLTSPAFTITKGLAGTNGLFRCKVQVPSGTATHTMGLWDGTTLTDTVTIPSNDQTTARFIEIQKPFGTAGSTIAIKFTSVASNEPLISVDDCYIGENFKVGEIAQARKLGSIKWAGATNCAWTTASTSFGNFSADTDCSAPTVTGSVTAPGTKIPAAIVSNIGPGSIMLVASGGFYKSGTVDAAGQFRFSDGTNTSSPVQIYASTGTGPSTTVIGSFEYTTPQAALTFNIQGRSGSASNFTAIAADVSGVAELQIDVYYYPSQSQAVAKTDNSDYDWVACTATGSWVSNTTYTCFEKRLGDTAYYRVKATTTGTPTNALLTITLPNSRSIDTAKLTDTTSTIPTVGTASFYDNGVAGYYGRVVYNSSTSVAVYAVSTSSTYMQPIQTSSTVPFSWGNTDIADIEFHVPIVGWTNSNRAPLLIGSVTSATAGMERIERAVITNNGSTCVVSNASSSWITSASRTGTGNCTLTVTGFSAIPACFMTQDNATAPVIFDLKTTSTNTSLLVQSLTSASVAQDASYSIMCMGPR